MIITDLDRPLTAEDARKISLNNRDDSVDRYYFRDLMSSILLDASFGRTRHTTAMSPRCRINMYSKNVQDALRSMGYKVVEKRVMEYDEEKKDFSTDRPKLDHGGREQFFLEITWG